MVGLNEVIDGLFHPNVDSYEANVVRKRISRTIFSLLCGAALGVSGALMQAVTRNPIADPSILGVNTGASLFVVCGIAFLNISTANQYIWLALAGAAITAVFVFGIGSMGRSGATPILTWLKHYVEMNHILTKWGTCITLDSTFNAIQAPFLL